MPRVIKHPDVRRDELLDLAFDLFLRRGYEQASLNDLIAESGLSKGAFYHYFSSKDRLLDALAQRIAQQRLERLQSVFETSKDDPLARLNRGLARSAELKIENAQITGQAFGPAFFFSPENAALFQRINVAWEATFTPLLARAIRNGIAAGRFKTEDPEGIAEMLQQLMSGSNSIVARGVNAKSAKERLDAANQLQKRLDLHGVAISKMLGLPDESVKIVPPGFAKRFLMAFGLPRDAADRLSGSAPNISKNNHQGPKRRKD